jgi:hypothetical protein
MNKNLGNYFDRVVVINLKRRPARLEGTFRALREARWPFRQAEVFDAVDGLAEPPPSGWRHGAGAWGCLCSHRRVLRRAARDGVKRLLVLEDDVCFAENFREEVARFLRAVPADWDQLMLGGQHLQPAGPKRPVLVKSGIYRCVDCERTHCYAVQGKYLRKLCARWYGGGVFNGQGHCDWIMGRDPELQAAHKVYAPEYFLAGQRRSPSDIKHRVLPKKFWNPPGPELAVINLHASQAVAQALRAYGFYTGYGDLRTGCGEPTLQKVFRKSRASDRLRVERLREWIKLMQWEVGDDPDYVCTVWHPQATPRLVRVASLWPVYEMTVRSVEEALRQFRRKLGRPAVFVGEMAAGSSAAPLGGLWGRRREV